LLLHFRTDDGDRAVDVIRDGDCWRVILDGRELAGIEARPDGRGGWSVTWADRRRSLQTAAIGDERLVFCDGITHRLALHDPDRDEADEAVSGGPGLRAEMPGKVVRVLVQKGDAVMTGRPLLILESMKMETELLAAVSGTVQRVHVSGGQVVAQGDPLVDITEDEPS